MIHEKLSIIWVQKRGLYVLGDVLCFSLSSIMRDDVDSENEILAANQLVVINTLEEVVLLLSPKQHFMKI